LLVDTVPDGPYSGPPMDEMRLRQEMCSIGSRLYQRGLVVATDGNLSARVASDALLVTPAGTCKGMMLPEELIVVDLDGNVLAGEGKPSSEIRMHLAAYQERPDVMAVVHAHPPTATAFTVAGVTLAQCIMPEVVVSFGAILTAPYATPSTEAMGDAVRPLVQRADAVLLDLHGALTLGPTLLEAFYRMERVEWVAQVTLSARQIGNVRVLPQDEVARLLRMRDSMGMRGHVPSCNDCGACVPSL